jgi:hypothetical protein
MAQPVLNNNMNFTLGDSYSVNSYNEVFNIVPGPAGANMVWDFEEIDGDYFAEGGPNICVDPSTTHFADSTAVMQSDIAIASMPTDPMEPYIYQYVTSSNSSREHVAMGMYLDGLGTYAKYNDSWIELIFPMEYGDSYDFGVESLLFNINEGYYYMHDSTEVTVVADAWGSIKTPVGEFPNVLRLKSTEVSRSWYKFDIGDPWMYMGEFTTISYRWFAGNIRVPVMVMHELDFKKEEALAGILPTIASICNGRALMKNGRGAFGSKQSSFSTIYLAEYDFQTSIDMIQKSQFNVYPNPAREEITVLSDMFNDGCDVLVYNHLGALVLRSALANNKLNVSSLKPGLYIIELDRNDILMRKKLVIH